MFKFGDGLHKQLFVDLLSSDASLEEVDGRGEALLCFFREMEQLVGGPHEAFGLGEAGVTFAWVVSMRSWVMRAETMLFIMWWNFLGEWPNTINNK